MTFVIWLTGLPGSGKSAISRELLELLREQGVKCEYLKLDKFRKTIVRKPHYDVEERDFVYSILIEDATELAKKNKNVLIDATGYKKEWRDRLRKNVQNFVEVFIKCPLKVCIRREAQRPSSFIMHGIYKKALARKKKKKQYPGLGEVVGIDVPYEENARAEIVLESNRLSAKQAAVVILHYLSTRGHV
ncbi:MAG: adenylyl-sulfate kinase [Candidatus Aenigmarchaeota archaeon]|nr:adenylyl-sulfate kinase [Candidatus Aenigmarchaeota archaeon]MBI5398721.1 adenylyl-sulfate kinase [Candidatus Woesearchaeota archaeon]